MNQNLPILSIAAVLALGVSAQSPPDNPDAKPPLIKADLQIVQRAREILDSPAKWNRADNRVCPEAAKTFSLYCALETATSEVMGHFEHRGAAMQETRFVIDELAPHANYEHRLMGYNNDPHTTFPDIQKAFDMLEARISNRLEEERLIAAANQHRLPLVTKADLQIIRRVRQMLDSPSKWNRADTQDCPADANTISLFCALKASIVEVNGKFGGNEAAMRQTRRVISESAPNCDKYQALLTDYNNDPTVTFADIQKLLQIVEEYLAKHQ